MNKFASDGGRRGNGCGGFLLALMAVLVLFTYLVFSTPVEAGTNWACDNHGQKLQDFVDKIKSNSKRRSHLEIIPAGDHQIVIAIIEGVPVAGFNIFLNQCAITSKTMPLIPLVEMYDIDLKEAFPVLKKGSF